MGPAVGEEFGGGVVRVLGDEFEFMGFDGYRELAVDD